MGAGSFANLTPSADTLRVGEQVKLYANVGYWACYPIDAPARRVDWFVGGGAIESVEWADTTATVKAIAPGTGYVTGYYMGASDRSTILVTAP